MAQQLREATSFDRGPKYLIRDNDSKVGVGFARVSKTSGIEILTTPYHAPRAIAICERFLGSVRRECLDHLLILHEKQHEPRAGRVCSLRATEPDRIQQQIPERSAGSVPAQQASGKVISFPVWEARIMPIAEVLEFAQRGRSDGLRDVRETEGVTRVIPL
jgi:putative transposase